MAESKSSIAVSILFLGAAVFLFSGAAYAFSFHGEIDFRQSQAHVEVVPLPDSPPIDIVVNRRESGQYTLSAQVDDVLVRGIPLTMVLEGRLMPAESPEGIAFWRGDVVSDYVLLDHKPISGVSGHFEFREGFFYLRDFVFNGLHCKGQWEMTSPYPLEVRATLKQWEGAVIQPLLAAPWMGVEGETFDGEIFLSGVLGSVAVKGKILSSVPNEKEGTTYQQAVYIFSGIYPKLQLRDSLYTQDDGITVLLNGELDLSSQKDWERQVADLVKAPIVQEGENAGSWTLKRVESSKGVGATELKYLWRRNDEEDPSTRSDSGMLGVERKIEF
jgi:hypothetical protein